MICVIFLLLFKKGGNHLFAHCVNGHQNCDHWRVFLCLQEATVTLDDGCAWTCDRDSCLFPPPPHTSSGTDVAQRITWYVCVHGVSVLHWLTQPELRSQLPVELLLVPSIHSISSSTGGRLELPPLSSPSTNASNEKTTTMCEFNSRMPPVPTRSSTNSFSRKFVPWDPTTTSHSQPDCA